jgi:hypothetical protein
MGRGPHQPDQAVVVHVSKDGGDGSAFLPIEAGRLRTPSEGIEVLQQKLVHFVIGRVSFQQKPRECLSQKCSTREYWIQLSFGAP